ncbi:MAG: hypothetical protein ABF904_04695 [Ethanoligenens sp.]
MIVPVFMAVAFCAGLFLLFGVNPAEMAKRLFHRRTPTFEDHLLAVRGIPHANFLQAQFARTDEILRVTGRDAQIGRYKRLTVLFAVVGAGIGVALLNPLLAAVLALFGLLIPHFTVQMSLFRFQKESRDELFTVLSLVTSSYARTGNLEWAVEENISHIHPPVESVFAEFLRQCRVVDPSVSRALTKVRGMVDQAIWREWCDAMQLCIVNPAQQKMLHGIVEKCGRQNRAQNELESLLPRPLQQMFIVMAMALSNIPVLCFLFGDFKTILFQSIQGKCALAVMAGAVLFSVYKAVHAARPVNYGKAAA